MPDDFAYINARIRGMRGRLLSPARWESLLQAATLEDLVSLLGDTAYGPALESALAAEEGLPGVESGLRAHVSRLYCLVPRLADGEAGALLGVVLGRWENRCAAAVLRGVLRRAPPGEILGGCVPAGTMDEPALRELSSRGSVEEVIDLLSLWGFGPARRLRKVLRESRGEERLQRLEHALDQEWLDGALARLERSPGGAEHLRPLLHLEADLLNFLSLCRLVAARSPAAAATAFFLRGGRSLTAERYHGLAGSADVPRLLEAVSGSRLGTLLERGFASYRAGGRLSAIEREARRALLAEALRAARRDPLGPGLAAGFVWAQANELTNLRLLCRARRAGLPARDLAGELLFDVN